MKLKTRLILNRALTFILGVLLICMGMIKNIETFVTMGIAMIICMILLLIKQWNVLFNPDKMKELENTYNDERVIFIAQKSYSFAFWVSIYVEFASILVTTYLGIENIPSVLSLIVCFQTLIYVVAKLFYSKKY